MNRYMKKVHWSKLPFKIGNWRKIIWLQNWINMFIKKGSHSNMKFVAKNLPKRMTFGLNFLVTLVTWMRIWYLICKKDLKFERFLIMNYSNILSQMIFPFIHFISNLTFERFSCIINNSNMLSEFIFPFKYFISNLTFERFSCIMNNSNMLSQSRWWFNLC